MPKTQIRLTAAKPLTKLGELFPLSSSFVKVLIEAAKTIEPAAETIVSQRHGNCTSGRNGIAAQTGLLKTTHIKSAKKSRAKGARSFPVCREKRAATKPATEIKSSVRKIKLINQSCFSPNQSAVSRK